MGFPVSLPVGFPTSLPAAFLPTRPQVLLLFRQRVLRSCCLSANASSGPAAFRPTRPQVRRLLGQRVLRSCGLSANASSPSPPEVPARCATAPTRLPRPASGEPEGCRRISPVTLKIQAWLSVRQPWWGSLGPRRRESRRRPACSVSKCPVLVGAIPAGGVSNAIDDAIMKTHLIPGPTCGTRAQNEM